MADLRIAVVGLGPRGRGTWIPLLQRISGYRIVAICDPIVETHERARAAIAHDVRVYRDYADVLADEQVDAIALTVRAEDQGALAARALDAGKHVHAEVPAAHSIDDCWAIVVAAERSGKVYALAEQTRYWGFVDVWRDLVASGRLGEITLCEGQYFHYLPTESADGWLGRMTPIHYLPHELSPMLKVLDDRVVQVVGMSTAARAGPPYLQVALMRTAKGAILRMATSFAQPHPHGDWHWYEVAGTGGRVEWRRSRTDTPKQWYVDTGQADLVAADWSFERSDAPAEARGSGHGDADYYTHVAFRDAVTGDRPLELDVYGAMDTAAPAILAAESIDQGSVPLAVPDFRPGPHRPAGALPATR